MTAISTRIPLLLEDQRVEIEVLRLQMVNRATVPPTKPYQLVCSGHRSQELHRRERLPLCSFHSRSGLGRARVSRGLVLFFFLVIPILLVVTQRKEIRSRDEPYRPRFGKVRGAHCCMKKIDGTKPGPLCVWGVEAIIINHRFLRL